MHTLQIRNVPEDLYKSLKALAEKEERSISRQALVLIRTALESNDDMKKRRLRVAQSLEQIKKLKSDFNAVKELRRDRDTR